MRQISLSEFVRSKCAGYVGVKCIWLDGDCPLRARGGAQGKCAIFEGALLRRARREGLTRVVKSYAEVQERARQGDLGFSDGPGAEGE